MKHHRFLVVENLNKVNTNQVKLILVLFALFFFNIQAEGKGGYPDEKFGKDGFVFTQVSSEADSFANDLVIQNDGKIIAVGTSFQNGFGFALVRYKIDGQIDPDFGNNGIVVTNIGYFQTIAFAVELQSDGKIVVGGFSDSGFNSPDYDFTIARYNSNGSLDNSFGNNGIVVTNLGSISENVFGLTIQSDGKIIATGYSGEDSLGGNSNIKVVRYNADGTLDTGFGSSGVVTGPKGVSEAVALQSDGKIVIAGYNVKDFVAGRYNSNGTPDTTFDGDGIVYTSFGNNIGKASSLAIQKDGKIILGGVKKITNSVVTDFALTRYQPNGTLDTTFDNDGIVTTDFYFNSSEDFVYDVAIQKDGRIVAVGESKINNTLNSSSALARYNIDGSLDKGFGDGGTKNISGSGFLSAANSVALQKDGKFIIAGGSNVGQVNPFQFYLIRFEVGGYSPMPRGSFDFESDGLTDVSIFRPANNRWYWLNSSNGNYNEIQFGLSADKIVPADYDGDWKTDIAVFRQSEGKWYILQSSDSTAVTIQLGSNGDIPLPGYYDIDDRADICVFRPSNGTWYWQQSSNTNVVSQQFGVTGDIPITSDFNNDGESDLAVFRPGNGTWYWKKISDSGYITYPFGQSGDTPVAGDFDGDGKTDYAVFRIENGYGIWYLQRSSLGSGVSQFGLNGDRPSSADFDGDGISDLAVWRSSNLYWYWVNSSTGGFNTINFGLSGDLPIPSAYTP